MYKKESRPLSLSPLTRSPLAGRPPHGGGARRRSSSGESAMSDVSFEGPDDELPPPPGKRDELPQLAEAPQPPLPGKRRALSFGEDNDDIHSIPNTDDTTNNSSSSSSTTTNNNNDNNCVYVCVYSPPP